MTHLIAPLTKEDIEINRQVAKRIGSWEWLDCEGTARVHHRREFSLSMTLHRVGAHSRNGYHAAAEI